MDDQQEWKSLPEHKLIEDLKRNMGKGEDGVNPFAYWHSSNYYRACEEAEDQLRSDRYFLDMYTQRITPCDKGVECTEQYCSYFHSKSEKRIMKQMEQNQQDRLFYKDNFYALNDVLNHLTTFIPDVAGLIRDYCCDAPFLLTKDGLTSSLMYCLPKKRRQLLNIHPFEHCVFCENRYFPYNPYESKTQMYTLTKKYDETTEDYCIFDERCGKDYLGLNPLTLSISMKMHGWKLSFQTVLPKHKRMYNLIQYIEQQEHGLLYDSNLTSKQRAEIVSDLLRRIALLRTYQERIRLCL
jgi:hypothetical protein